jgi:hypothetical protein
VSTPLSIKIHEVVARVLSDAEYAATIKRAALAAVKGGARSAQWKDYFERFASTPGELANLGIDRAGVCNNTFLTISSLVTPVPTCCNTTTTTTTSGNLFGTKPATPKE